MTEYITPRVDIAFKKLFGVEENKDLLISLINSIVAEEDQVMEVELLNPYNPRNFKNDKLSILDIKAKGHTGKLYNIELQITDEANYDKRALYYWAKLYTEQLKKNGRYSQLNKTIGIHILKFTGILSTHEYHNCFKLLEVKSHLHYFKDIELHTIELNKFESFTAQPMSKAEELKQLLSKVKTSLDRWLAFLTRHDLLEAKKLPKELNDPNLEKALEVLEVMNFSEEEREAYEAHLKWLRLEISAVERAEERGEARGQARGQAIGETIGEVRGEVRGEARGLTKGEKNKAIEVTKKMLSKNKPLEEIIEFSGLTEEEIKEIAEESYEVL